MIEQAIDYAIESNAFQHAFELARISAKEKLPEVIDILISAVEKGELDEFLISPPKTVAKGKSPANAKLAKS